MKRFIQDYPVFGILLLLLACVRFEYHASSWALSVPGLVGGMVVLGIVAIVLLFRTFNAVQDACIAKSFISQRLKFKYDLLIPVAIIAATIRIDEYGPMVKSIGRNEVPLWEFHWGDPQYAVPFIGAVVLVVLLLRVLTLLRAIANGPKSIG